MTAARACFWQLLPHYLNNRSRRTRRLLATSPDAGPSLPACLTVLRGGVRSYDGRKVCRSRRRATKQLHMYTTPHGTLSFIYHSLFCPANNLTGQQTRAEVTARCGSSITATAWRGRSGVEHLGVNDSVGSTAWRNVLKNAGLLRPLSIFPATAARILPLQTRSPGLPHWITAATYHGAHWRHLLPLRTCAAPRAPPPPSVRKRNMLL